MNRIRKRAVLHKLAEIRKHGEEGFWSGWGWSGPRFASWSDIKSGNFVAPWTALANEWKNYGVNDPRISAYQKSQKPTEFETKYLDKLAPPAPPNSITAGPKQGQDPLSFRVDRASEALAKQRGQELGEFHATSQKGLKRIEEGYDPKDAEKGGWMSTTPALQAMEQQSRGLAGQNRLTGYGGEGYAEAMPALGTKMTNPNMTMTFDINNPPPGMDYYPAKGGVNEEGFTTGLVVGPRTDRSQAYRRDAYAESRQGDLSKLEEGQKEREQAFVAAGARDWPAMMRNRQLNEWSQPFVNASPWGRLKQDLSRVFLEDTPQMMAAQARRQTERDKNDREETLGSPGLDPIRAIQQGVYGNVTPADMRRFEEERALQRGSKYGLVSDNIDTLFARPTMPFTGEGPGVLNRLRAIGGIIGGVTADPLERARRNFSQDYDREGLGKALLYLGGTLGPGGAITGGMGRDIFRRTRTEAEQQQEWDRQKRIYGDIADDRKGFFGTPSDIAMMFAPTSRLSALGTAGKAANFALAATGAPGWGLGAAIPTSLLRSGGLANRVMTPAATREALRQVNQAALLAGSETSAGRAVPIAARETFAANQPVLDYLSKRYPGAVPGTAVAGSRWNPFAAATYRPFPRGIPGEYAMGNLAERAGNYQVLPMTAGQFLSRSGAVDAGLLAGMRALHESNNQSEPEPQYTSAY